MEFFKRNTRILIELLSIAVITALTYLPKVGQLGYFRDDWYFIYDAHMAGPQVFIEMFKIDRPLRGILFEFYYALFGLNPFPYHLTTYFWRFLGALAVMALFLTLWPKQRKAAYYAALISAVFPGFLLWVQGVEYIPHAASLCLQALSIFLTLKAIQAVKFPVKIAWLLGAILTGWLYLGLVEYAIGMEAFRLLCVFMLVTREMGLRPILEKMRRTFYAWVPSLIIPLAFVIWRVFFFQNERKATDPGFQLSQLLAAPLVTIEWWVVRFFQSFTNLAIFSWGTPLYQYYASLSLRDMLLGLMLAVLVVLAVLLGDWLLSKQSAAEQGAVVADGSMWALEAVWLGALGMVFGLLPVVLANRYFVFRAFSHYGLPASLAAAFFAVGLVHFFSSKRMRLLALTVLLAIAALTHYSVAAKALDEETAIQKFWWQVSWRAPGIKPDITLLVTYPGIDVGLDPDIIWDPANFLYYPNPTGEIPVHYRLASMLDTPENTRNLLLGAPPYRDEYRSHYLNVEFSNFLILSQPTSTACVHAVGAGSSNVSADDSEKMILLAGRASLDNILTDAQPAIPLPVVFGSEPRHDWCYYYEKTDLAVQQGNWNEALKLADQALEANLTPQDDVEWLPLLKAYGHAGDQDRFNKLASKMAKDNFVRAQACTALTNPDGWVLSPELQQIRDIRLCQN